MERQTRRIADCMDCSKRGWCFLFFEQRPDGTPRGIWLCSDCIDIKRGWRNFQATTHWRKEPEGAKFPIPVRIDQFRRNGELGAATWITVRRSTLKARVNGTRMDDYVKNGYRILNVESSILSSVAQSVA